METRTFQTTVQNEARTLSGLCIVYDSPAIIPVGNRSFTEVIRFGALTRTLKDNPDIRCLFNHDTSVVLGRTKAGTLQLSDNPQGLKAVVNVPDTQAGRDCLVSCERGDIDGWSFGFNVKQDRWTETDEGTVRELLDIDLIEVSPCVFPAYGQSSLHVRSNAEQEYWYMQLKKWREKIEESTK